MKNNSEASFKLRLLAQITEFFIFFTLHALFWFYLSTSPNSATLINRLIIYLIMLVVSPLGFIYNIALTHNFGGTLGKLLTGLKIVGEDGKKLPLKRLLFRQTAGYSFASTLFGFGFYSIIKHPQKQGWHDQATGSKVIVTKSLWPLSILISIALLCTSFYLIGSTIKNFKSGNLVYEISSLARLYQLEKKPTPTQTNEATSSSYLQEN